MKSIAEFVAGKIRRSESSDVMTFVPSNAAHAILGAAQGMLIGPAGEVALYEDGMVLADGTSIEWNDIARVVRVDEKTLVIDLENGSKTTIAGSEIGCEILFSTLRWIGNALLRRNLV